MTWLVFALGTVLALAGAISLASGIPYIQVEWGWTEVIAGATALSAGVVTFALGAVLFRLNGIERAIQRGGFGQPVSAEVEPQDIAGSDDEAAPAERPPVPPTVGRRARFPFGRRAGRAARSQESQAGDQEGSAATPPDGGDLEGTYAAAVPEPELDRAPDAVAEAAAETPGRASWTARLKGRLQTPGNLGPGPRDRDSAMNLGLRPTSHPDQADTTAAPSMDLLGPAEAPEASLGQDGHGFHPETFGPGETPEQEPAPEANHPPFHRVGVEDVAAAPTVVGRYESGGASYVLLSDGAIEVQTGTGLHRFASMQELKLFIDSQELQGSVEDR